MLRAGAARCGYTVQQTLRKVPSGQLEGVSNGKPCRGRVYCGRSVRCGQETLQAGYRRQVALVFVEDSAGNATDLLVFGYSSSSLSSSLRAEKREGAKGADRDIFGPGRLIVCVSFFPLWFPPPGREGGLGSGNIRLGWDEQREGGRKSLRGNCTSRVGRVWSSCRRVGSVLLFRYCCRQALDEEDENENEETRACIRVQDVA